MMFVMNPLYYYEIPAVRWIFVAEIPSKTPSRNFANRSSESPEPAASSSMAFYKAARRFSSSSMVSATMGEGVPVSLGPGLSKHGGET